MHTLVMQHHVCNFKPTTQRSYAKVGRVVLPVFENYYLQQIDLEMIYAFLRTRKELGAKAGTLNKFIFFLKAIFNFAFKMGYVQHNITRELRKYKEPPSRDRVLSEAEEVLLYSVVPAWLGDVITIAIQTGMRSSEITNLTWDRIDFDRRFIFLADTKSNRPRVIPLTQTALDTLTRRKLISFPYVFRSPRTGRPYVIYANFRKYTKGILDDFHFHDLRHTAITRMIQKGLSISAVMKIVGHSSETMTAKYTHLSHEYLGPLFDQIKKI